MYLTTVDVRNTQPNAMEYKNDENIVIQYGISLPKTLYQVPIQVNRNAVPKIIRVQLLKETNLSIPNISNK
jgi:hypothetical protein